LNLEDGQATVLVMLDCTRAFAMIAQDLMVCKMRAFQRYSDGVTAFGSYLSDRTRCVRSDGEYSTVRCIEYRVPKSSVLKSPFLFISFIFDVSGVIHFCHIYADDLQIYHNSSVADL
jgi:hypothetical protein